MFWADTRIAEIKEFFRDKIKKGEKLIIRDEKTLSGRVHVGSLRGVSVHGILSDVLTEEGVDHEYLYEINDFDPMDGLPDYLAEAVYKPHMGKPLFSIPSPDGKALNYAEYFAKDYIAAIAKTGFTPTFYRLHEKYVAGDFNEVITLALDNSDAIRTIYKEVSGSEKSKDWYPLSVICEKCGKIGTTQVTAWDGKQVSYICTDQVEWASGCGHEGEVSPYDGNAKLPWKVEWAAKFKVFGVDIEGAGKDHSTKGGSRDVANRISQEVFGYQKTFDVPYEFFNLGGKKMSSSKGLGASAKEIADLLPTTILRLLLLQRPERRAIDFDPQGDSVPNLFDTYDRLQEIHFAKPEDDGARLFSLIHSSEERESLRSRVLPRFSQVAYLMQLPHVDIKAEIEKNQGVEPDFQSLALREKYAKVWMAAYAPEDYKIELQEEIPVRAKSLTPEQKSALTKVLEFFEENKNPDGQEVHTALHGIKEEEAIEPSEFFSAIYLSLLGKTSGPKAGWFLSVINRKFLIKRLKEVIS